MRSPCAHNEICSNCLNEIKCLKDKRFPHIFISFIYLYIVVNMNVFLHAIVIAYVLCSLMALAIATTVALVMLAAA